jgi:hypothetical protein
MRSTASYDVTSNIFLALPRGTPNSAGLVRCANATEGMLMAGPST